MTNDTPMNWPTLDELVRSLTLPAGVTLRLPREEEFATLPGLLREWYPQVRVGAESIFLNSEFLKREVVTEGNLRPNIYAIFIVQHGLSVGFTSYERQPANATLHGRLGVLAPEARTGFLGALGFMVLETIAKLTGAELILVWLTLASKNQQYFAERKGYQLVGIVPGFDRDQLTNERSLRVSEALVAKLLVPESEVLSPAPDALTPRTKRLLEAIL